VRNSTVSSAGPPDFPSALAGFTDDEHTYNRRSTRFDVAVAAPFIVTEGRHPTLSVTLSTFFALV